MPSTKEQKKLYNNRYYEENKDKLKKSSTDYYVSNKEKVLENVRNYRETNRDTIQEKGREYYRRKIKNRMLNAARARAKKKQIEFDLTEDDFDIPEKCPLLNTELFIAEGRKSVKDNSPSLDRIDPSKGYIKGNVWVVSHRANTIKSNAYVEEVELLVKNWRKIFGRMSEIGGDF